MKDFFTQCMKDLYALTGIEQVRWMQNDLTNGARDFNLCVEGMVQASKQFPYIPEEDQKAIITRMMIEDRQYKTLNSRTIWGWLDGAKGQHFRGQTHFEEHESKAPPYDEYVTQCILNGMEPLTEAEYDKPVDGERLAIYAKMISQIAEDMTVPRSSLAKELKSRLGSIECKHPTLIDTSDTEDTCNDCGKTFPKPLIESTPQNKP